MHVNPGLAAFLAFAIFALFMVVSNLWIAANGQAERASALSEFLENPVLLARVWYQKPKGNPGGTMYIFARHTDGRKILLGVPSDAAEVWSRLQSAGIVVHSSP
jgi:lipopolysaccharide export LptBFGC system permease protein LptF